MLAIRPQAIMLVPKFRKTVSVRPDDLVRDRPTASPLLLPLPVYRRLNGGPRVVNSLWEMLQESPSSLAVRIRFVSSREVISMSEPPPSKPMVTVYFHKPNDPSTVTTPTMDAKGAMAPHIARRPGSRKGNKMKLLL